MVGDKKWRAQFGQCTMLSRPQTTGTNQNKKQGSKKKGGGKRRVCVSASANLVCWSEGWEDRLPALWQATSHDTLKVGSKVRVLLLVVGKERVPRSLLLGTSSLAAVEVRAHVVRHKKALCWVKPKLLLHLRSTKKGRGKGGGRRLCVCVHVCACVCVCVRVCACVCVCAR